MGVFGGPSSVVVSRRLATHHGTMLYSHDLAARRQAVPTIFVWLHLKQGIVSGCREDDGLSRQTTPGATDAFDRLGGLEYEGTRHHGQGKVEPDVDKDYHEQSPAELHPPDSTRMEARTPRRPSLNVDVSDRRSPAAWAWCGLVG